MSQSHELLSLAEGGVTSIGLEIRGLKKLDQSSATNQVLGWSDVALSDGRVVKAYDVGLSFKSRDYEYRLSATKDSQYSSQPAEILLPEPVV